MSLQSKNAIVTGASRGLGARVALDLAKDGASVLLTYTSPSSEVKAKAVVAAIEALGNGARAGIVKADASDPQSGLVIVKAAITLFGEERVDILIHNAGILYSSPLEQIDLGEYFKLFNTNVMSIISLTQATLPYIPRGGRVVHVSSMAARQNVPGQAVYAASKAAGEALMRVWSNELRGRGITFNSVNPGPIETDMMHEVPQETWEEVFVKSGIPIATVAEISDIIVWLATDKARWVTGSVVSSNNGVVPI